MRYCAVNTQCASDANAHDHKSDLVDHAVAQYAAHIVFDGCVEYRKDGHDGADVDEQVFTGKSAREGIYGGFGGKCTQKYRAHGRGFWIGVNQPVVEQGKGAFDSKG